MDDKTQTKIRELQQENTRLRADLRRKHNELHVLENCRPPTIAVVCSKCNESAIGQPE